MRYIAILWTEPGFSDTGGAVYLLEDSGLRSVRSFGSRNFIFDSDDTAAGCESRIRAEIVNTYGMDCEAYVYALPDICGIISGGRGYAVFSRTPVRAAFPLARGCYGQDLRPNSIPSRATVRSIGTLSRIAEFAERRGRGRQDI